VELYRTPDLVFYESQDGEASVDLSIKSDGKRKLLEWGIVHWIKGMGRIREAWEAQRSDPPMSYHGGSGHDVVVHLLPSPAPDPEPAPQVLSEPRPRRHEREPEQVAMHRDPQYVEPKEDRRGAHVQRTVLLAWILFRKDRQLSGSEIDNHG